jgi:hypothetical protein
MPPALSSDGYIKSAHFLQEEEEEEVENRLLFEMELWRADLLSSVVEVDAIGNIIPPDASEPINPMCPAGLAAGAGLNSLSGHISRLAPAFKGCSSIPELMSVFSDPNATLIKASMRGGRQGAKVQQISGVQTIKALHQGDSALINLTAQVVIKNGTNSRAFVVFSVDQPQCGRPDFCVWLKLPFVQTIHVKPSVAVTAGNDGIYLAPAPRIGSFGQISALPNVSVTAALQGIEMPHATSKLDPNDVLGQLQRELQDDDEASPRVQVKPKILDQIRFQEPDRDSPKGRVTFGSLAPQASGMSQVGPAAANSTVMPSPMKCPQLASI